MRSRYSLSLLYWYKSTQFTCLTSTKFSQRRGGVGALAATKNQKKISGCHPPPPFVKMCTYVLLVKQVNCNCNEWQQALTVLTLLALLVHKYTFCKILTCSARSRRASEGSMLTYAGVCWRRLTYAHVCSRMLTHSRRAWEGSMWS